jgi:hypothetical protein
VHVIKIWGTECRTHMSLSGHTHIIEVRSFYQKVAEIIVPFTFTCGRIYPQADGWIG